MTPTQARRRCPNLNVAPPSSITLLGSSSKSAEMDFRTTWTTPAVGQTRIALTEPVPLAFADLSPPELNRVILGVVHARGLPRPASVQSGRIFSPNVLDRKINPLHHRG